MRIVGPFRTATTAYSTKTYHYYDELYPLGRPGWNWNFNTTETKRIEQKKKKSSTLTGGFWWAASMTYLLSPHEALRVMCSNSSAESHFRPLMSSCWNIRRRSSSSFRTPLISLGPFNSGSLSFDKLDVFWWSTITISNLGLNILNLFMLSGAAFTSLGRPLGLTLRSRPLNIDKGLSEFWISSSAPGKGDGVVGGAPCILQFEF